MSRYTQAQLNGYRDLKVLPYFLTEQSLLRMLKAKGRIKNAAGGENIVWDVRLSGQSLKSFGPYATFTASERGDYAQASLPWAAVYADDSISGLQKERQGNVGSLESGTIRKIRSQALDELKEDFFKDLNTQLWNGDGALLNSTTGANVIGVTQSVVASPATGSYAGINRATVSNHRNQQFSAASGPNTNAATDAWWAILNMKSLVSKRPMGGAKAARPDMLLTTRAVEVLIKNKGYVQNQNVGATVNGIDMIEGMEITVDDDVTAGYAYMLSSETFELLLPAGVGLRDLVRISYKSDLEDHVHPEDEALVMYSHLQLRNMFPKANGVITSFS